MASSSAALVRLQSACVTCVRGGQRFVGRYHDFLLAPGTIFTSLSLLLLILATIQTPDGLINSAHAHTWLYLAAALVGSVYIWWSAIQGIRERDFTADIPVSFATAAALIIGQYSAAAVVAVLLLLGGMLEVFISARAGNALDSLAKLLPDRVTVRRNGEDRVVALSEVESHDLVLVRSGDRIPVDGSVEHGTASVNQAAITGESLPVDKQVGDQVYAGTLNEMGALEVRATKVGTETTLGQIRRMVEEAQEQKAPIERILNRYAKFYTPAALILGALVWWWSGDLLRAITILIVFCPCVMVLATPTALVASIAEKLSEHPLGRAVVQAALTRELTVTDPEEFTVLPGLGVRARLEDGEVVIGRPRLLSEQGIAVDAEVLARTKKLAEVSRTVILVAHNTRLIGMLVLEDTLRPRASSVITRLKKLGIRTILVTGDNVVTAQRIAGELGISEVHAEVLPAQKVEIVKQLQAQGHNVAFVGDGVNDGPALATANVGVAMGLGGTDVAIETAEIALLSDDLTKLPHLLSLSLRAMRAIKQNLIFSLSVLAIAVGLAIIGILAPVTGALDWDQGSLRMRPNLTSCMHEPDLHLEKRRSVGAASPRFPDLRNRRP